MKREILFRGKRPNSGKLIEGYLYQENGLSWILSSSFKTPDCSCEVISESVGQFTGLTDKNGKKIFEGDIVTNGYRNYIVTSSKRYGWVLSNSKGWYHSIVNETTDSIIDLGIIDGVEVIGNIHDNPELL